MTAEDAVESQLATLAACHVGLFTGAVAKNYGSDATALVAHALWLRSEVRRVGKEC